ncbi:MAG: hypothetical protein HYT67_01605 [Candidatus Yanofskybacteria bacterium]|nr:hypothetical protein [Candidatus Yanofskybacteria bacterium]
MSILYNKGLLKWLVLLALLLLIVSFVSFWFGRPSFSEAGVVLKLDGPSQVSVGDEVTYKLTIGNDSRVDLNEIRIKFSYPDDSVVIKDGSVVSDLSQKFEIDKLSPGQKNEMEFKAFLVGDRGNIKTTKAELNFKAGDLRTQFEKETSISTTITSLPVSLTLVAPPNAAPGQAVNYILDYRNESGSDIADLLFEFDYPDGFAFQKGIPSPSRGNSSWTVPVLKKNAGGRINIQGALTGREGEAKKISVVLKRKIADRYVNYEKAEVATDVANPLLGVDMLVNDSTAYSAFPGDDLNYTVKYSNASNFNLIGLNLVVKLDGQMYDLSSLDTKGGYYDSSNGTILWNASTVPDFANLPTNKKGEVLFRIKLKNEVFSGISGSNNLFVQTTATLSTPNVPSGVGGDEISAQNSLTTKITTQPTFRQLIYHNDPAFSSSGPLPPEVGKDTSFTIHWQLTNPGNDMNSVRLTGVLPPGVTWENATGVTVGQPEVTFNPDTSEVVWNLGVLPRGIGVVGDKYEASFRVRIKPSSNQKGTVITLIKNSKLTATDSFTKQNIILPLGDMTTDDLTDRPSEGTVK